MGLLQKLAGNAQQVDITSVQAEMAPLLIEGETIEIAFQVIRDKIIFTNVRLITVDKQGVTSRKLNTELFRTTKLFSFPRNPLECLTLTRN